MESVQRREEAEEGEEGEKDVTGVRVCRDSEKLPEALAARLYSTLTSFRGQRLLPGMSTAGYDAPYSCREINAR